jgi:hypothetical protein
MSHVGRASVSGPPATTVEAGRKTGTGTPRVATALAASVAAGQAYARCLAPPRRNAWERGHPPTAEHIIDLLGLEPLPARAVSTRKRSAVMRCDRLARRGGRSRRQDRHLLPDDPGRLFGDAPAADAGAVPLLPRRPGRAAPALPGRDRSRRPTRRRPSGRGASPVARAGRGVAGRPAGARLAPRLRLLGTTMAPGFAFSLYEHGHGNRCLPPTPPLPTASSPSPATPRTTPMALTASGAVRTLGPSCSPCSSSRRSPRSPPSPR